MKAKAETPLEDEMRSEYTAASLKDGVRGKYAERYSNGTNVVVLDADVAEVFPNAQAVNNALRLLMKAAQQSTLEASKR